MLALYNQTAPEMGLDLELQVENVLKAPGMAQVCGMSPSLPSLPPLSFSCKYDKAKGPAR